MQNNQTPISRERLEELKELHGKTTPGNWATEHEYGATLCFYQMPDAEDMEWIAKSHDEFPSILAALEADRWRKFPDELPPIDSKCSEVVLLRCVNMRFPVRGHYCLYDREWRDDDDEIIATVTHWRPDIEMPKLETPTP